MPEKFLNLARKGQNHWWRYILAIVFILFSWLVIGEIPTIALILLVSFGENEEVQFNPETGRFEGVDAVWVYVIDNFAFIAFSIALYVAISLIHKRDFNTLITPSDRVRFSRIFQGFGVWLLLLVLATSIEGIFAPSSYKLTFDIGKFLIFLPLALILTPIQSSAEEFFFRSYLMQAIGLTTRKAVVPILVSSFIFMFPHLANPEMSSGFVMLTIFYFAIGLFLAIITVKDNTLELALGIHAANNLFTVLVANPANSAIPSPSIFTYQLNAVYNSLSFFVMAGIFYAVFFRSRKAT